MKNNSRRIFIRNLMLAGVASYALPGMGAFARTIIDHHKLKAKKGMVILFQGDSITDGNRGRNDDPNHIMGHGYVFGIASRLGADYPEKRLEFYNRGISGNKVDDLANRWQNDTLDLKPDMLSILIGVNDTGSVVYQRKPIITVEKYEEVYRSLLEMTWKEFPQILFVLGEPFILPVGGVKENWDAFHSDIIKRQFVVRSLAQEFDAVFVGFQEMFNRACKKAPADYWIWDGVHPRVAGHELMAREWIKQVGKRVSF